MRSSYVKDVAWLTGFLTTDRDVRMPVNDSVVLDYDDGDILEFKPAELPVFDGVAF